MLLPIGCHLLLLLLLIQPPHSLLKVYRGGCTSKDGWEHLQWWWQRQYKGNWLKMKAYCFLACVLEQMAVTGGLSKQTSLRCQSSRLKQVVSLSK
jgi:hypothetical protein